MKRNTRREKMRKELEVLRKKVSAYEKRKAQPSGKRA
jgi:hypothetical protein